MSASFNSLQTGRYFRTPRCVCTILFGELVSIPFKREGISERLPMMLVVKLVTLVSIPFKREGISELITIQSVIKASNVSIPFKREGISELNGCSVKEIHTTEFQFPSNGKVFPNVIKIKTSHSTRNSVSIPFKREGISER